MEVDDAYLGGEKQGKRGRNAASKTPFIAAIQTNSERKPLYIRLTPIAGFTYEAFKQWSAECLSSTAWCVSDGLRCFRAVTHTVAQHERQMWEVENLLYSVPSFAGSIRFPAISRLPSAEHTIHSTTPSMHSAILQNSPIASIAVLIWLPLCRDCCAPPQRQHLFRSVY